MSGPIYIIGHKNPDTDAICSAIGYANLKHRLGEGRYIAARCGNSNARIDTILQRFRMPLPHFLSDVTPRLQDIMVRDVFHVQTSQTCAEALELIDTHDVRVLPVLNEDSQVAGTVSIFQLGEHFIPKPSATRSIRHVYTSINDIVRALNGNVIHCSDPDRLEDLYVRVGAMDIRRFGNFTTEEPTLAEQSIIVVGDRYDIQTKAISAGVRLIVVSGDLEVEAEIIQMAKDKDVSLVISPYDTATTSWIIRTANRVEPVMETKFERFSRDEKLGAVIRKVSNLNSQVFVVTSQDGRLEGVFSRSDLLKPSPKQIVLVDHNELSQAVDGADKVTILEIIDHHRLGNPPSPQPIFFHNEPVGSTCTIVADLFRRHELEPKANIAGCLMAGIISDTLNLNGPTTTEKDKAMLEWLTGLAQTDPQSLAEDIFAAGAVILSLEPEEVIRADMKTYEEGDIRYSVSQVEELGFANFWKRHAELAQALKKTQQEGGLFFSALLVTDINSQSSLLLVEGDEDVIRQITYPKVEHQDDVFDLRGVVSRKKQVIPYIANLLKTLGVEV